MNAQDFLGLTKTHNPHRWYLPVTLDVCTPGHFLYGGAALAAGVTALQLTTGRPIVWATAQYLSYARPPSIVDIDVVVPTSGHNVTQARAVAHVDDKEIITINGALGRRDTAISGTWVVPPASVPDPDSCPPRTDMPSGFLFDRIEKRLIRWPRSHEDGRALFWVRIPSLEMSAAALALIADFMPNAMTDVLGIKAGGTSLDNTIRILRTDPTDWVLCDCHVHGLSHGFGHGLLHMWSKEGALLATGSQSFIFRSWEDAQARHAPFKNPRQTS